MANKDQHVLPVCTCANVCDAIMEGQTREALQNLQKALLNFKHLYS